MKTIGLLGGTGWASTIGYYVGLNQLVNDRLGGYHSAKIILKSIDYHEIMTHYGKDHKKIEALLREELLKLIALKPDCIIICCNSLHKYYDLIKDSLSSSIPVMHAVDLVVDHFKKKNYKKAFLLATKFTMEDGFFAKKLELRGVSVVIPNSQEREEMQRIHGELMQNKASETSKKYFKDLILKYRDVDAIILGCTEYSLVVSPQDVPVPLIDPVSLQTSSAVDFALS